MRVLFDVTHPALVHLFGPTMRALDSGGHDVTIAAREKDVTTDLLDAGGFEYEVVSSAGSGPLSRVGELIEREVKLLGLARRTAPDVVVSQVDPAAVHAARLVGARAVVFDDSEHERLAAAATHRFADVVCTPVNFDRDVPNQRRYRGFHELAYLHPARFSPDADALRRHGVDPESPYSVVRFVSWSAHHDLGRRGFSLSGKRRLIQALSAQGDVYVSSEAPLPPDLTEYASPVPVDAMHDLLAFADCYAGDSQTMATEAAVLGTPAVRTNAFVGDDDMSNFRELEAEYGLLRSFDDENDAVACAAAFARESPGDAMEHRRQRLLAEKEDVTAFLIDVIQKQGPAGIVDSADDSPAPPVDGEPSANGDSTRDRREVGTPGR